jgi:hypothetical protein
MVHFPTPVAKWGRLAFRFRTSAFFAHLASKLVGRSSQLMHIGAITGNANYPSQLRDVTREGSGLKLLITPSSASGSHQYIDTKVTRTPMHVFQRANACIWQLVPLCMMSYDQVSSFKHKRQATRPGTNSICHSSLLRPSYPNAVSGSHQLYTRLAFGLYARDRSTDGRWVL